MSLQHLIRPLFLLISFFLPISLYAGDTISSVTIKGNLTVSTPRIILMMKTKVGGEFDEQILKRDIQNLMETGYFSSAKYSVDKTEKGLDVVIELIENPRIEEIRFDKSKYFKKDELEKSAGIKKGDYCNEELLNNAILQLKKKYDEKGIWFSDVSYSIQPIKENRVIVKFNIKEGGKISVSRINFSGNSAFKSDLLRKKMKIKQRKMPFIKGTFKPEILDADIKRIEDFYHNNGYPDCNVKVSTSIENRLMTIDISINEGQKMFFGSTKFSGNPLFSVEHLKKCIIYHEGEVYSQKKFDETQRNISRMYSDAGYIRPSIFPIPTVRDSKIDVEFIIQPGEKVYINEINITGNTITKDKVIRREFVIHPGDEYSGAKISKSFNNLADLQFFDEIEILPEPAKNENFVDLNVKVKDKERTGIFAFGGGYSSVEDVIGFISIEQRNFDISDPPHFRGAGQDIRLQAEMGGVTRNFMLSFTEPYLFDRPISFGPDIFKITRDWDDYTEEHNGLDIRVGRRWENLSLGFKIMTEDVKLSDIDIPEFQNQKGSNRVNSLTTTLGFQNLDRKILPKQGDMLQVSVEYAGSILGSDIEYVKTTLENNYYKGLGRFVFHSKTYAGKVDELDSSQQVPIYERFFGGGIGTVRGYKERELGPRSADRKYYLGGQSIFAQNLELLYPLTRESEILWGVIFYDIGNVWNEDFDFGDIKQGAGIGIRIKVPIMPAPIQVDYGWAINPESYQDHARVHIGFTLGF